jgi:CMP-2-keto-3-deoxyoctulosonic acid synthetase
MSRKNTKVEATGSRGCCRYRTDIVLNVQGDTHSLKEWPLLKCFDDKSVQVALMMQVLTKEEEINDPNFVKVAVDKNMNSLFFSRSVIPYPRDKYSHCLLEHIVYAFRKQALLNSPTGQ